MTDRARLRCAIYTRKSSEEGLDQDFNSLEAQREACEAYIKSQSHEGWGQLAERYDDGGYSGGNMDRPALKELLEHVNAGRIDIIIVYKIDRLTRSLTDFARLAELLDEKKVSFVSVTQQFNTTTSMGRLMLNVLLSFAQFEREITGERIRDKIAASKKKGMWMGGPIPFGYRAEGRQLVVSETEATQVRRIFEMYLESRTVPALLDRLASEGIRTPERRTRTGKVMGNLSFTRGHLYKFLSNPLYLGKIVHKGVEYEGQHPAIISTDLWGAVQAQLAANRQGIKSPNQASTKALLVGRLFSEEGTAFTLTHAIKRRRKYHYYVSRPSAEPVARPALRFPAAAIDQVAVEGIREFLRDEPAVLRAVQVNGSQAGQVLETARTLAKKDAEELALRYAASVTLNASSLKILLDMGALSKALTGHSGERHRHEIVRTLDFRRRGKQVKLVSHAADAAKPDSAILLVVARAFEWFDRLATGQARSIADLASSDGFDAGYVSHVLRLAFLPPSDVEAICAGRWVTGRSAQELLWNDELPLAWNPSAS